MVTDPRSDRQAVVEASYVNIPCIALCDTDSMLEFVDIAGLVEGASKGEVSLVETSASPVDVDRDAAGGGHLGSYKGNQAQAGGILGMLATIQTDFEKTIKVTEESEAKAAAAMTKMDRESKGSIQSKSTGLARNTEETIETTGNLQANLQALKNNQDLLDESLKSLAILRPKCIDTKMSYAERVARREKEIEALKKAVCSLRQIGRASCRERV